MANTCAVDGCLNTEPDGSWGNVWPVCRVCATPVCADHIAPGSEQDHDERGVDVVCRSCQTLEEGLRTSATLDGQWSLWHVCESVLTPTNQNLLNGDLNACLRDMATEILLGRDMAKASQRDEKGQ